MKERTEKENSIYVYILSLLAVFILVVTNKLCEMFLPGYSVPANANLLIKIFMVIVSVIAIILVLCGKLSFSFSFMKISKECNLKREIIEVAVVIILFTALMIAYRLYMNTKDPVIAARPCFALYLGKNYRWSYPIISLWQEILIKPLWQDNVKKAMGGKKWLTLVFIGLLFSVLHMHYKIYTVLGAGILCFVTGILYERDKNIWGVWILHFYLGFFPTCLGL
jgi:hypothetical protein